MVHGTKSDATTLCNSECFCEQTAIENESVSMTLCKFPFPLIICVIVFFSGTATTLTAELLDTSDLEKWIKLDTSIILGADGTPTGEVQPWGPGIFDTSDGALNLRTTGVVPAAPCCLPISGFLAVGWAESAIDPRYSNGSVRTKFRVDTNVGASINLRSNVETFSSYNFIASAVSGEFALNLFVNGESTRLGAIPGVTFNQREDWWMEASAVGDQLAMKVWQDGTPEPMVPQLTVEDSTHSQGIIGLGAGLLVSNPEPVAVDATFDDVSFVPEPGSTAMTLIGTCVFLLFRRRYGEKTG